MNTTADKSSAPVTGARVTREINLIARNLACHGAAIAAAETAAHIRLFWAPSLQSSVVEQAHAHPERFSPIASGAIAMLEHTNTAVSGAPYNSQ